MALSPLRDSGDVIGVVLIAHDADDFAAIVLKALSEDLDQKVGDVVPKPGWAKNSVVTRVLIWRIPFPVEICVGRPRTPPSPTTRSLR